MNDTPQHPMETVSEQRAHGGVQGFYRHASAATGGQMGFAVYLPPAAEQRRVPVVYFLAGLTCNEETATIKAGAQAHAARLGLALVMPDTSPRGADVPGEDDDWDFGTGAGFYVDATEKPWAARYQMYTYVTQELRALIEENFAVDGGATGIMGHSMGGHGALTIGLRAPQVYRSVSAFAPICAPTECPWGKKALAGYLGDDLDAWRAHDAAALLEDGASHPAKLLVDQGDRDQFLAQQLHPQRLQAAAAAAGQELELRMQPGYDHSYYFIQTFVAEHLAHHAAILKA